MLKQEPLEGFDVRGSIVNVTSVSATMPADGLGGYSASKGGLLGMNKTDALDYGPDKIRVNSVAPGIVLTPMLDYTWGSSLTPKWVDENSSVTPLRRCGRPEDIANAIVWLSSPLASFITGISLTVDGGLSLATTPQ
jgi:NAD(P)-dependent dehydrogenase (short-subunit alcohol dehydrogenase family)